MSLTPLLLMLLAHLGADFILQTDRMARARSDRRIWPYIAHGSGAAGAMFLALHPFGLVIAAILAAIAAALHLGQDCLKDLFWRHCSPGRRLFLFLADQFLHLAVLFALWQRCDLQPAAGVIGFYRRLFGPRVIAAAAPLADLPGAAPDRILLVALVYVAVMFGGANLMRVCLDAVRVVPAADGERPAQAGKYIGILERGLILTLVLSGAISSVGFVFAAKSIARFKELERKEFAEYYLVGTLGSTLLSVAAGLALRAVG